MKVLVTGAAGFIGFHLTLALLERGDEVGFKPETSIVDGLRKFVHWYGQSAENVT